MQIVTEVWSERNGADSIADLTKHDLHFSVPVLLCLCYAMPMRCLCLMLMPKEKSRLCFWSENVSSPGGCLCLCYAMLMLMLCLCDG